MAWTLHKSLHAYGVFGGAHDFPEFLGIGAQKAGTTWLFENLRHHPDLFLPPVKEVHYFDVDYRRPLRTYLEQFRPGRGKIRGEVTPDYSILPAHRVRLIRRLRPDLKTILFLRNPIDRAWSHALMALVKLAGRRIEDVSEAEFSAQLDSYRSRVLGEYGRILETWSVFPPEQMFIGWFEDIALRPKDLLRDVFAHLGVSREVDVEQLPYASRFNVNEAAEIPLRFRSRLAEQYASELERLEARFGERVARWRAAPRAGSGASGG
jgi:hypothetical protein